MDEDLNRRIGERLGSARHARGLSLSQANSPIASRPASR